MGILASFGALRAPNGSNQGMKQMTQVDTRVPTDAQLRSLPMTAEMPELGGYLAANFDAVASHNRGAFAPSNPIDGMTWWDTSVEGMEFLKSYRSPDGWTEIGRRATGVGGVFTPAAHTHPYAPLSHVGAGGVDQHPAATADLAGFMSPTDKSKLDGHVGVGGDQQHPVATRSLAGFMSSNDKGRIDDHIGAGGAAHAAVSSSVNGFATPTMLLAGVPVGMIAMFPSDTMPTGWLTCAGQAVSRSTYAALFAVFGTTFGVGDGSTTFNLPDARGRVAVGSGTGTGLTARAVGAVGGKEKHQLAASELPGHTHSGGTSGQSIHHTHEIFVPSSNVQLSYTATGTGGGYSVNPMGWETSAPGNNDHTHAVTTNSGDGCNGVAHENMPPFLALNVCVFTGVR